ncbi:hypothetical protein R1flu_004515 [Riccia fluitans]|uniref:Uncharacterized protein n=1 Tax=Riccia fluitans TaxID=41844 RepID=A0ABD1YR14_9MARC
MLLVSSNEKRCRIRTSTARRAGWLAGSRDRNLGETFESDDVSGFSRIGRADRSFYEHVGTTEFMGGEACEGVAPTEPGV